MASEQFVQKKNPKKNVSTLITVSGTPFHVARNSFYFENERGNNESSSVTLTDHLPQVPHQGLWNRKYKLSTAVKS